MQGSSPRAGNEEDVHGKQPVLRAGAAVEKAVGAIVLVHGRGGSAGDVLSLYDKLDAPLFAAFAPQAAGHSWYPHSFLAPLESNQPCLNSALNRLERLVAEIISDGMSGERIILLGFSQGACLTVEYAARHPRRYGAIIGLTGGLIGPPGVVRNYAGSLAKTPVFLGSGDPDPHVPFERVQETADVLRAMDASVDLRRYPGMPHSINEDEMEAARLLIRRVAAQGPPRGDPAS
jgi:phospholipase/carboxylesterase